MKVDNSILSIAMLTTIGSAAVALAVLMEAL
jgi:hypothetical protein